MPMTLGAYLRALRLDRGLSLGAVAKAAGCSPVYVSDIECGKRHPMPHRTDILARILAACGAGHEHVDMVRELVRARACP